MRNVVFIERLMAVNRGIKNLFQTTKLIIDAVSPKISIFTQQLGGIEKLGMLQASAFIKVKMRSNFGTFSTADSGFPLGGS
jgi:hypothetical protein